MGVCGQRDVRVCAGPSFSKEGSRSEDDIAGDEKDWKLALLGNTGKILN